MAGLVELTAAFRPFRRMCLGLAVFSGVINVLYLTASFFMLEVYDRVLPSRSVATLVALFVLALLLYCLQGVLDAVRGRMFSRIGASFDASLAPRVFDLVVRMPLVKRVRGAGDGLGPLRDLDQIRTFLAGGGPGALFDLPWIPLYLLVCFAFHPLIGYATLAGAVVLFGLTLLTDALTRKPLRQAYEQTGLRLGLAEAARRNAEALRALGMAGRLGCIWMGHGERHLASQQQVADVSANIAGVSKFVRLSLQSGVLGLGAYLVIKQEATSGVMVASSILTVRALAPVESAIANWKGLAAARLARRRLGELLASIPPERERMPLPAPRAELLIEDVAVAPPGENRVVVEGVSMRLKAGSAVGIIGPSGSGKSSLARAIVGVWPTVRGAVRLDGALLDQWAPEALGAYVGYLPQDVELFAGTVAQNIARFDPGASPEAIIAAAKAAGVHELILRMPDGYDMLLGEGGTGLSGGQRQRVGLARALYGDPFLVVLDEPNSNLDADGEAALTDAILGVRARGGIALVIAHRPSALAGADHVLVVADAQARMFGPKNEVLARIGRPMAPAMAPSMPAAPSQPPAMIEPAAGVAIQVPLSPAAVASARSAAVPADAAPADAALADAALGPAHA